MNITLSADKELIRKSRDYAESQNTSLNNLIRDYLRKISGTYDLETCAEEFAELAKAKSGKSPKDYKFDRESIYDRG